MSHYNYLILQNSSFHLSLNFLFKILEQEIWYPQKVYGISSSKISSNTHTHNFHNTTFNFNFNLAKFFSYARGKPLDAITSIQCVKLFHSLSPCRCIRFLFPIHINQKSSPCFPSMVASMLHKRIHYTPIKSPKTIRITKNNAKNSKNLKGEKKLFFDKKNFFFDLK